MSKRQLHKFGEKWYFNNVESFNSWTQYISPFIWSFFISSLFCSFWHTNLVHILSKYFMFFGTIALFKFQLLIVHFQYKKNTVGFCKLTLYCEALLSSLTSSSIFLVDAFTSYIVNQVSANSEFYFSFSNLHDFYFLFLLLYGLLYIWFNIFIRSILHRSRKSRHCCFIPHIRRKTLDLSTWSLMLAVAFSQMPFIK